MLTFKAGDLVSINFQGTLPAGVANHEILLIIQVQDFQDYDFLVSRITCLKNNLTFVKFNLIKEDEVFIIHSFDSCKFSVD